MNPLHKRGLTLDMRNAVRIERQDIRGLEELLLSPSKQLISVPARELKPFKKEQLMQFCHEYGFYQLITDELIAFLREELGDSRTVEIGAGNGAIAQHLPGITATDSYVQDTLEMRQIYGSKGVVPVHYGTNVLKYEAVAAVKEFQPQAVLGCWVTHLFDGVQGFADGVDEERMMAPELGVEKYLIVGNKKTHDAKPILKNRAFKPKQFTNLPWLYSRSMHPELNTIYRIVRR